MNSHISEFPLNFFEPARARSRNAASPEVPAGDLVVGDARVRHIGQGRYVAIAKTGDWRLFDRDDVAALDSADQGDVHLNAELLSKFLTRSQHLGKGSELLFRSRIQAKRATISNGPSLHIIVPTLQCAHSCQYCQVSRAMDSDGHVMSVEDLDAACDAIFESSADALTVEFQGGDPLLRFDLVEHAIRRITTRNVGENRSIRFVVASTLHQLNAEMCAFFREYQVFLSTSIDGPAWLHNRNRPTPERDAYERTIRGIRLAQEIIGPHSVSALMTTTKLSLDHPEEIVDEYVKLRLPEIFLRPLSSYGFAKRNQSKLGYTVEEFQSFYERALDRVLWWNAQGVAIREVYASIICNKILSTFDAGYVDLQSPTGAGASVLVYNYDGYVYPSDEARMLAETGETGLRIRRIQARALEVADNDIVGMLRTASLPDAIAGCDTCAYHAYCGPNPVDAFAQHGDMNAPVRETEHCMRHLSLFDRMFKRLDKASESELDMFYAWARPALAGENQCAS